MDKQEKFFGRTPLGDKTRNQLAVARAVVESGAKPRVYETRPRLSRNAHGEELRAWQVELPNNKGAYRVAEIAGNDIGPVLSEKQNTLLCECETALKNRGYCMHAQIVAKHIGGTDTIEAALLAKSDDECGPWEYIRRQNLVRERAAAQGGAA